jgi:hypothetical protein
MPWESIIPNVLAGEGQPLVAGTTTAAMDNEQFAAFYARSARSLLAYLARGSRALPVCRSSRGWGSSGAALPVSNCNQFVARSLATSAVLLD